MFRKSPIAKQFSLFSSPSELLCKRESRTYDNESAWHNKFYKEVTSRVDEDIFKPLYTTEREDNRVGRPNVPIRMLVAMMILKEGCGVSDEQLYEQCRFNLLYRRALGLVNLDEQCPTIDSYYGLRRKICKYNEENNVNLFDECFKQITKAQAMEYHVSGKSVRMDSKLISSNIAWYSRYEIIHETFVKSVSADLLEHVEDQLVRQQALDFFNEDAEKTVYRSDVDTMGHRLLSLGIVIDYLLTHGKVSADTLLGRVFSEQYEKAEDGKVTVRDKRKISARSVQNPNDPDAEYRGKNGKKVKGFSTNLTETTDEEGAPNLITDVTVKGASAADNGFLQDAIDSTKDITGNEVQIVYADGAYQSKDNRKYAEDKGIEFVANGIQGKPSRFDLNMTDEHTLKVTDKATSEVWKAIPVKQDRWKIPVDGPNGERRWRYFSKEHVERADARRRVESIPYEERKKRNNVEASIFQYCLHTRNNRTRYRTLIKHTLHAIARCAWINMRRLCLFDLKTGVQIAE